MASSAFTLRSLHGVAATLIADSFWFLVGRRHGPPRAAHALQAVARADHLRAPHAGLLWPPPRRHARCSPSSCPAWPRWRRRLPARTAWALAVSVFRRHRRRALGRRTAHHRPLLRRPASSATPACSTGWAASPARCCFSASSASSLAASIAAAWCSKSWPPRASSPRN